VQSKRYAGFVGDHSRLPDEYQYDFSWWWAEEGEYVSSTGKEGAEGEE
jgi:hypothetical protein